MASRQFRTVQLDEQVVDELKSRAVVFEDRDVNDVLRRLLGLSKLELHDSSHMSNRRRHLATLILEELARRGGRARASDVTETIKEILSPKGYDVELVKPGVPRWVKDTHFARLSLVRNGLLSGDSQRGVWELTTAGNAEAKKPLEKVETQAAASAYNVKSAHRKS